MSKKVVENRECPIDQQVPFLECIIEIEILECLIDQQVPF
jgi:hypothetical protein